MILENDFPKTVLHYYVIISRKSMLFSRFKSFSNLVISENSDHRRIIHRVEIRDWMIEYESFFLHFFSDSCFESIIT